MMRKLGQTVWFFIFVFHNKKRTKMEEEERKEQNIVLVGINYI